MVQPPLISKPRETLATGDRNAPPGSEAWAIAIRLDILTGLHESSWTAEHIDRLVTAFREHQAWRHLSGPNGPFRTWESFCITRPEKGGLGYDPNAIAAIIAERHDELINARKRAESAAQATDGQVLARGQPRKEIDKLSISQAERGRRAGIGVVTQKKLDYLARHAPELLERVRDPRDKLSTDKAYREARGLGQRKHCKTCNCFEEA